MTALPIFVDKRGGATMISADTGGMFATVEQPIDR
jgi:hypothetical protein